MRWVLIPKFARVHSYSFQNSSIAEVKQMPYRSCRLAICISARFTKIEQSDRIQRRPNFCLRALGSSATGFLSNIRDQLGIRRIE